ncbi:MAG: ATP-binding protein [Lachnospiraceae bacterium]|nr:ATP-binding protein [Lachnospiraceae bacterium]
MGKKITDVEQTTVKREYKLQGRAVTVLMDNVCSGVYDGQRITLDEDIVDSMADGIIETIKKSHTKYIDIPEEIIIKSSSSNEVNKSLSVIDVREPKYEMSDIALNDAVRDSIRTAISALKNREKMSSEWGLDKYLAENSAVVLNFYGKPGTGKSLTAEAVAKELNKKVYRVNYSELESKYVGETPKNIRKAFETAKNDDAVLIFDEADSFLGKRLSNVTQSADYGVNITRSVLLMELEKFEGVVIFTTNLIKNYDEAFKRRILLSVYFEMPDEESRGQIWKSHLGDKLPLDDGVTAALLASRYDGVSGADIRDIVFYAALHALDLGKERIGVDDFDHAKYSVMERYQNRDEFTADNLQTDSYVEENRRE